MLQNAQQKNEKEPSTGTGTVDDTTDGKDGAVENEWKKNYKFIKNGVTLLLLGNWERIYEKQNCWWENNL